MSDEANTEQLDRHRIHAEFARKYPDMAFRLARLLAKKAEDLFSGDALKQIQAAAGHTPGDGRYGGTPEGAICCTLMYFGGAVKEKYGETAYTKFHDTIIKNLNQPVLLALKMEGIVLHQNVAYTIIGNLPKYQTYDKLNA